MSQAISGALFVVSKMQQQYSQWFHHVTPWDEGS